MKSFVTKTLATGIFLLIPVFFFGYALTHSFERLRKIVEPLAAKLDVDRALGMITLDVLTVLVLVAAVFVLGLIAYIPAIAKRVTKIDELLEGFVPGYTVLKGIIGGAFQQDTGMSGFKSVLVRYNGTGQIGFEVERTVAGGVVVFLPNTPNPRTGTTAVFDPADVEPLNVAPHKALEMLTFFGTGAAEIVETGLQQRDMVLASPSLAT